jgi:hypothetical protein
MSLLFTIVACPRQRKHPQVRVPRESWPLLLLQIPASPNLEGQVPVFISPRNMFARLYPQALGFSWSGRHGSVYIALCRTDRKYLSFRYPNVCLSHSWFPRIHLHWKRVYQSVTCRVPRVHLHGNVFFNSFPSSASTSTYHNINPVI